MAGGLNLYGYANGDPINQSDPFGLCPFDETGVPCRAVYAPGVKVSDRKLRLALDQIAAEQDRELIVYSGDRTEEQNKAVRGSSGSSHLTGSGADVIFRGMTKNETFSALYGSEARRDFGVRLLYHGPGAALPEHSHLDLKSGPDLYEMPKGSEPRYLILPVKPLPDK